MLCAMIGKNAFHLLHFGNKQHISKENKHPDKAFQQMDHKVTPDPTVNETYEHHRQQEKQHYR